MVTFIPFGQHLPFSPTPQLLETTVLLSVSMKLSFFICDTYKWAQTVLVFLWLISHSIMPSSSIHVVTNGRISCFLWLNNIPLCVYTFSLSIHLWMDTYLGPFYLLDILINATVNTGVPVIFLSLCFQLFGVYT